MPLRGRVLLTGRRSGAWNMALDEALLSCAREGVVTIRLYGWSPDTVSLGYFQPRASAPPAAAALFPLVRRPTGGGAIIHNGAEVTVSITGVGALRAPRPEEAARWFLEGARAALAPLGVHPRLAGPTPGAAPRDPAVPSAPGRAPVFFCASIPSPLDLVVDGPGGPRKLAGTAQRRRGRAWLIHGGIPVEPRASRIPGEPEGVSLREAMGPAPSAGPGDAAARPPLRDAVLAALARSFPAALGAEELVEDASPSAEEARLSYRLLAGRYSSREWMGRR